MAAPGTDPDAAYAAEASRPPLGGPPMYQHGWALPWIMLTVVIKIKARVKR
jgi:hypothetical protein